MDDKSYSDTHANDEAAPPAGASVVHANGTRDASKFTGCYFMVTASTWTLYNKSGHQLATGPFSESTFMFDHDVMRGTSTKITWTVTNLVWTTNAGGESQVNGSWTNNDDSAGPQSGTFEASSGGASDPVTTKASA